MFSYYLCSFSVQLVHEIWYWNTCMFLHSVLDTSCLFLCLARIKNKTKTTILYQTHHTRCLLQKREHNPRIDILEKKWTKIPIKNYTLIVLLWRQVRLVINYLTANYSAPKVRFSNIPFGLRKAKIRFAVYNSLGNFSFYIPSSVSRSSSSIHSIAIQNVSL